MVPDRLREHLYLELFLQQLLIRKLYVVIEIFQLVILIQHLFIITLPFLLFLLLDRLVFAEFLLLLQHNSLIYQILLQLECVLLGFSSLTSFLKVLYALNVPTPRLKELSRNILYNPCLPLA